MSEAPKAPPAGTLRPRLRNLLRGEITSGVVCTYLAMGVGALANIVVIPIFLKNLGMELYGLWSTIAGVVAYLALLNFGLSQSTANQFSEAATHQDMPKAIRVLATGFWLYARIVAIAALVVVPAALLLPRALLVKEPLEIRQVAQVATALAAGLFLIELPMTLFGACLRGVGRVATFQLVLAVQTVVRLAAGALFVTFWQNLYGLIALLEIVNIATYILHFVLLERAVGHLSLSRLRRDSTLLPRLRTSSSYFFVLQIAGLVAFNSAPLIISGFLGVAVVTPYSVMQRLVFIAAAIPGAVAAAFYPAFLRLHAREQLGELSDSLERCVLLCAGFGGLAALVLARLGHRFMILWVGKEGYAGDVSLYLFVAFLLIQSAIAPGDSLLTSSSRHHRYAVFAAWEAALNVGLSLALVRRFEIAGVVAAIVIGRIFGAVPILVWETTRLLGARVVRITRDVAIVIVPGLVAAGVAGWITGRFQSEQATLPSLCVEGSVMSLVFLGIAVETWRWTRKRRALERVRDGIGAPEGTST